MVFFIARQQESFLIDNYKINDYFCPFLNRLSTSGSSYGKDSSDYDEYEGSESSSVWREQESAVMETPKFTTDPLKLLVNEGEVIRWGGDLHKSLITYHQWVH